MRAVVQRVSRAEVLSEGVKTGAIGQGLMVLLGVETGDTEKDAAYMAQKSARLRIFEKLVMAGEGVLEHFGRRVFEEIRQEYGTFERFMEAEYGLDAARLSELRERYLEPIGPVRYDMRRRDLYV